MYLDQRNYLKTDTAMETQPSAPETLSNVNDEALKALMHSNDVASAILTKIRGAQPAQAGSQLAKMPERSIYGDAKEIRDLTYQLCEKLDRITGLLA